MTVKAAGGVLWRATAGGGPEVLVVHRPRYDDWSFPKGKLDRGETFEAAAVREIEEETGFTGRLGAELSSTRYHDRFDRPKVVRYWLVESPAGEFVANDEVDEAEWLSVAAADARLTYERDRELLAEAAAAMAPA